MSNSKKVIIVGGHGNISLRLARLLGTTHAVKSIIRTRDHESDIKAASAEPVYLSLEDSPVSAFSAAFEGQDVVYFSAGAGGKGGAERTKAVDYEGAVKVFDAVEGVSGAKPRLVLVSAIDVRNPEKVPTHYNETDLVISRKMREAMGSYMHWKYEADKDLANRVAFKWTILRPSTLTDGPGTHKASIGKAHLGAPISREDVANTLALLLEREDAAGLAIDLVGGDTPIKAGLDAFIAKGETDFLE